MKGMRPVGWRYESRRHGLAARGIKTNYYASKARRYNYVPTYVASDLPLIAGDALGTVGAEVVSLIPVAVPVAMAAGGAVLAKKAYDKTKGKKRSYDALISYKVLDKYKKEEPKVVRREVPLRMETMKEHADRLKGGRADGMKPEDFDKKQLKKGIIHEMEHTDDVLIAREIAMDHLAEDPKYYDHLDEMEAENKPKYMAFKKDKGILSEHKMVDSEEAYRTQEVSVMQQKVQAKLRKAAEQNDCNPDKDERFMTEDFKVQAEDFMNGRITKSQFNDNVARLLERHINQNRKTLDIWGWAK